MTAFHGLPQSYGGAPPETPFLRAKQEWDDRFGSVIKQAKNWRIAFFISSLVTISLASGMVLLSSQRRIIPIYVGIDRDKGQPSYLGAVEERPYSPSENEIKYFLSELVRLTRGIPADQVVLRQNWIRGYKFLRRPAANLLNEEAQKPNSPLKSPGERLVVVQPLSVVKVPNSASYQLRWKESVYKKGGQKLDEYTMLGTFEIELEPPKDEDTLRENPLGLFVKTYQWNREL